MIDISEKDTVYISGPMRHKPFMNFPAFFGMEAFLREIYGCKVLNPARNESGLTLDQYLAIDLVMVRVSDVIIMLDGWETSEGASLEWHVAKEEGLRIYEQMAFKPQGEDDV